jgi:hypothetical protein
VQVAGEMKSFRQETSHDSEKGILIPQIFAPEAAAAPGRKRFLNAFALQWVPDFCRRTISINPPIREFSVYRFLSRLPKLLCSDGT